MSIITIVEPTVVLYKIEMIMPKNDVNTEYITEHIVTVLKLLKIFIADKAGKITKVDISIIPTKFIDKTITVAITIAITKLYISTLTPVALAKLSSNVIVNNLL